MSRDTVADALDRAAEALAQAAHELRGTSQPAAEGASPASVPPRSQGSSAPAAPTGQKFTECPKHHKAFTPSKNPEWPSYCASRSDEPAPWSNDKGYCRINSKNAGDWLAVQKAAQPAMDDDSELPF